MVRNLVEKHKPIFLFIQESKFSNFDRRLVRALGGSTLTRGIAVNTLGIEVGLITLWNDNLFYCKACISGGRYHSSGGIGVNKKKGCLL